MTICEYFCIKSYGHKTDILMHGYFIYSFPTTSWHFPCVFLYLLHIVSGLLFFCTPLCCPFCLLAASSTEYDAITRSSLDLRSSRATSRPPVTGAARGVSSRSSAANKRLSLSTTHLTNKKSVADRDTKRAASVVSGSSSSGNLLAPGKIQTYTGRNKIIVLPINAKIQHFCEF